MSNIYIYILLCFSWPNRCESKKQFRGSELDFPHSCSPQSHNSFNQIIVFDHKGAPCIYRIHPNTVQNTKAIAPLSFTSVLLQCPMPCQTTAGSRNGFKKDGGRVYYNNCTLLLVWLTGFLGTILGAACLDFFKSSTVGGFTWCLGLSCFDRKKVTLPKTNLTSLTLKMDGWNTFLSFLGQKAHFQSVYLLFVLGGVTSGSLIF